MTQDWFGCYQIRWSEAELNSESFSHPAKMSKGLVLRIFQHCIDEGWITPGQTTVLDPFNGVGGTAYGALLNGCDYLGLELEPHFFDMSHGCDCTGMTAAEYRRYYGRFKRVAYKDRHICPRCLNELEQISQPEKSTVERQYTLNERIKGVINTTGTTFEPGQTVKPITATLRQHARRLRARLNAAKKAAVLEYHTRKGLPKPTRLQLKRNLMIAEPIPFPEYHVQPARQVSMFEIVEPDTLAYERNSGRIPIRKAHHYEGNVERWQKVFGGKNKAVVLQGDSRFLIDRLREAGVLVEGVVSVASPPYGEGEKSHPSLGSVNKDNWGNEGGDIAGRRGVSGNYGQSPGQLGAMSIGSPPFTDSIGSDDPDKRGGLLTSDPKRRGDKNLTAKYGSSQGQLGVMVTGEPVVSIGSPPYENNSPHNGGAAEFIDDKRLFGDYGNSPAQLANLPSGQPPTVSIGSPPFGQAQKGAGINTEGYGQDGSDKVGERTYSNVTQGNTDGQLANLPTGDVVSIGSPAFAGNSGGQGSASSEVFDDKDLFRRHSGGMVGGLGYGATVGQMGVMKPGVSVGSPPFENQSAWQEKGEEFFEHPTQKNISRKRTISVKADYGNSPAQLGNQSGDTFWSASSLIIAQLSYLVTHSVWVTKNYLKDGKLVDFTGQWIACCEAHGFELVHHHKAYQLQEKGVKVDFEGEQKTITKGGVSFFRGLVNRKHKEAGNDELVIEAEDVLCFVNRRFNG